MKRRRPSPARSAPRRATLTAQTLGARGDAVLPGPIYAPGLLPGETAELEVRGERGRVVRRLTDSPDRVAPFCPVADRCGGCSVQHFRPEAYRAWKRDLVVQALSRAGIEAEVRPLMDAHGEGRRRATFHAMMIGGRLVFGFMERAGDQIVDLEDCPVAHPAIRAAIPALRTLARAAIHPRRRLEIAVAASDAGLDVALTGADTLELAMRESAADSAGRHGWARVTINGDPVFKMADPALKVGRASVMPSPGGFLQATAAGEAVLAAIVMEAAQGAAKVIDLYAGSGAFALRLAELAPVLAVEGDAGPLGALNHAARRTPGLKPVDAKVRDLALEPLSVSELAGADLVVLDPPRAGAKTQCERLADSSVPVIVSISCNPATFARDAAILIEGGYRMGTVTPVDQFAWTGHVEVAAVFRRG
ncbi:class I SAM-dependent RNA methyltransferase [Alkalicaulis satelles]|uniref:Class I SAM-dependent RNA methyltransferase n=1 Tax=Alkalicaulis satelles TaxID=2609175 RepID=A0A5M6ZFN2_9PROT|nr:class I SAM-dependent RNA methyltransferase [Alkalicaulis satelles]KAA5801051.1 class I SAM-dependent RNA methyltransferase [Alkalicaulis satelles]